MGDEDNKKISDKLNADRSNEEDATYQDSVRNDPAADVDDGVEQIDYDDALERFSGRYQVFTFSKWLFCKRSVLIIGVMFRYYTTTGLI